MYVWCVLVDMSEPQYTCAVLDTIFQRQFSPPPWVRRSNSGCQFSVASPLYPLNSLYLRFVFQPVSHTHSTGYLSLNISHTHSPGYPSLNMCMSLHTWTPGLILSFSPLVLSWKLLFLISSKFWGRQQGFAVIKVPPPCSSFSKLYYLGYSNVFGVFFCCCLFFCHVSFRIVRNLSELLTVVLPSL